MTLYKRSLSVLVMLCAVTIGAFGGGFQLNEHGARAMAQGGAFAARATDGSAIFFNPAGLAFQDHASAYVGMTAIIPTVSFYGPLQDNTNAKTESPDQMFTPINGYLTYPLMDRLHVGIGVNNPYGLGSIWPDNWVGKFITTEVQLQSFYITPTVSYKIADNFSIGGGVSYVIGTVTLKRAVSVASIDLPSGPPRVNIDMTAKGWGWSLGAMYKLTPDISIGASYRSSVKVDASGDASFSPNYAALNLPQGGVSTTIELPATAFFGVAYKAMKNLEIEADYQFIGWSSYNELDLTFAANGSRSVAPKNYKDTYILRIGGEYTIDRLHLRTGYLYDHSPVQTQYVDPMLPDANRNGLNVGLGYDLTSHFSVDAAYLLLLFNERTAENTIPETSFDGTYHMHVNLFCLNFGYEF